MKEYIRLIEIQLPQDSEIIKALIASPNKEENIDSVEIFLYMGKGKRPLKIILRPKDDSDDFNVTTPLDTGGKAHFYIGKAQISISSADMFVKTPSKKYTVSTNLYSLNHLNQFNLLNQWFRRSSRLATLNPKNRFRYLLEDSQNRNDNVNSSY